MDFFDIRETLLLIPGIILGFSLHEYAHAQTAVWLGDNTPRDQGRLSLNPMVHIDPVGFLMILLARFGWARPVQVDPSNFKNPRRDDILVSLAGPLMNLFIALFFLILMKITYSLPPTVLSDTLYETLMDIFDYTLWINVVLFVFNLLPIPPLDGSHIFFGVFNLKDTAFYYQFFSAGRLLLPMLIITNALDKIIGPPIAAVYNGFFQFFF
ncbi:MAG: site-2 protease family protein [Thermotaleaceae bacterium]